MFLKENAQAFVMSAYSELNELKRQLEELQENKLYVKLSKCNLWLQEKSFLGHVISSGEIVVNPSKVDIV
jgi:hypothetical protein